MRICRRKIMENNKIITKIDGVEPINNQEIWKIYASYYLISNFGRIYSTKSKKLMNPTPKRSQQNRGLCYYWVSLATPDGEKNYYVHRVVAELFCQPLNPEAPLNSEKCKVEIHHRNFDTLDNRAENLMIIKAWMHRLLHVAVKKYREEQALTKGGDVA